MDLAFQTTIAYGGLGRYSIGLLSKLADYCDTITVYPTPLSAEVPTQHEWWREVPENVSVVKKHNFARSLLRDSTNFKKYDLVHINYASLGVPALLANSLFNTPYVYTVHHFDSPSRVTSDFGLRLKYEVERKLCFPLVSSRGALATVSEYNAKRMDGAGRHSYPHGINPERVQTGSDFEIRDRFGLRENSDIVLFVGKFHSYKNTIDLIKAFSLVSSSSDAELGSVI